MKILILYYSRTHVTEKVAKAIEQHLLEIAHEKVQVCMEEVIDKKDRKGLLAAIMAGFDAYKKKMTEIEPLRHQIEGFDMILVGTPVWSGVAAPAIRTILKEQGEKMKRVAFFCTMGGSGDCKTFEEMESLIDKAPVAKKSFKEKDVKKEKEAFHRGIDLFITKLIEEIIS